MIPTEEEVIRFLINGKGQRFSGRQIARFFGAEAKEMKPILGKLRALGDIRFASDGVRRKYYLPYEKVAEELVQVARHEFRPLKVYDSKLQQFRDLCEGINR
jgi:hypothetical protein